MQIQPNITPLGTDPGAARKAMAKPGNATAGTREHAEQTAKKFEALFIRELVSSLRESASIGEEGGMFGGGTGSDTYAGWFDQHVAEHLGESRSIGVQDVVLADMERHGQLTPRDEERQQVFAAQRAADRSQFSALTAIRSTIDVTR